LTPSLHHGRYDRSGFKPNYNEREMVRIFQVWKFSADGVTSAVMVPGYCRWGSDKTGHVLKWELIEVAVDRCAGYRVARLVLGSIA
jgi:hypothetical protein